MAKESMKAREVKRQKLVAKYAAKRKALKEAGDYEALQLILKMLLLSVCTIVANLQGALKGICALLEFHVCYSAKWQTKD